MAVAHYCGCIFHYIAWSGEQPVNWLQKNQLLHAGFEDRYINSIYFAIITMNTVGYGDITAQNLQEKLFVVCMALVSCGVFAFAVNTIGNIFQEKAQKSVAFKKKKYAVLNYMNLRNVNKSLQLKVTFLPNKHAFYSKVINYLQFSNDRDSDSSEQGRQVLNELSKGIREEVFNDYFMKVTSSIGFLQGRFSQKFRDSLRSEWIECTVGPGECICPQGQQSDKIYYILSGEVQQFLGLSTSKLSSLKVV